MKPYILILALALLAFTAGFFYAGRKPVAQTPQHLTLEKILSIKQLHLVKHTYNDLFYLHKHNNPAKAIRAIAQVPVEVTAYLDLKQVEVVWQQDTIQQILLPRATLNQPHYQVERMVIRETRSWQVHVGKDLYPQIGAYIQERIAARIDTIKHMAVTNRILVQAEQEGKAYVLGMLRDLGHDHIQVRFADEAVAQTTKAMPTQQALPIAKSSTSLEAIPFGFIPLANR